MAALRKEEVRVSFLVVMIGLMLGLDGCFVRFRVQCLL